MLFDFLSVTVETYPDEKMNQLLVFDGDDTLWVSEPLYDAARDQARSIVEAAGLPGDRWEQLERSIDVENVSRLGLSAERFPTSCVEAYYRVALEVARQVDPAVEIAVRVAAESVFTLPAPLVHGVHEVLSALASRYSLALLTQGDPPIQRGRLSQSGLEDYFDAISGVERKAASSFRRLLSHFDVPPAASWSIGNSLPSDINPALSVGMNAIWVAGHVWEYERRETQPHVGHLVTAESLEEVPRILAGDPRDRAVESA
jgi:putative hydrolase of the HAD superfamily